MYPAQLFKQLPTDPEECLATIKRYGRLLYNADMSEDYETSEMLEDVLVHLRYRYYKLQKNVDEEGLAFCLMYEDHLPEMTYRRTPPVCTPEQRYIEVELEECTAIESRTVPICEYLLPHDVSCAVQEIVTSEAIQTVEVYEARTLKLVPCGSTLYGSPVHTVTYSDHLLDVMEDKCEQPPYVRRRRVCDCPVRRIVSDDKLHHRDVVLCLCRGRKFWCTTCGRLFRFYGYGHLRHIEHSCCPSSIVFHLSDSRQVVGADEKLQILLQSMTGQVVFAGTESLYYRYQVPRRLCSLLTLSVRAFGRSVLR